MVSLGLGLERLIIEAKFSNDLLEKTNPSRHNTVTKVIGLIILTTLIAYSVVFRLLIKKELQGSNSAKNQTKVNIFTS